MAPHWPPNRALVRLPPGGCHACQTKTAPPSLACSQKLGAPCPAPPDQQRPGLRRRCWHCCRTPTHSGIEAPRCVRCGLARAGTSQVLTPTRHCACGSLAAPQLCESAEFRDLVLTTARRYVSAPDACPVARFHCSHGAMPGEVHWLGNVSAKVRGRVVCGRAVRARAVRRPVLTQCC